MNMSIVVPVYNEERTIVPVLHRPFIFPKAETIVVDRPVRTPQNGSRHARHPLHALGSQ